MSYTLSSDKNKKSTTNGGTRPLRENLNKNLNLESSEKKECMIIS